MKFVKDNYMYALWFIVYFYIVFLIFGGNTFAFICTATIYGLSIGLALSPIGEWLIRMEQGVREPQTAEEKNYLIPIFQEVYKSALEVNPNLSKKIKIYIVDDTFANAFACGKNTVAVTRGAIHTFSQTQLKAIISHELGHINYGHTKALLLTLVGNSIFSVFAFFLRAMLMLLDIISAMFSRQNIIAFAINLITLLTRWIAEVGILIFMYLGHVLLSLNSRQNEFQSDNFAVKTGYGQELISALYLLQKISGAHKMTLEQKMTSSHPHIASRIEKLESEYETKAII